MIFMKTYTLPIDFMRYEAVQFEGYHYLGIYPLSIEEAHMLRDLEIPLYELTPDDTEHRLEPDDEIHDDLLYGVALIEPFAKAYNKHYGKDLSDTEFVRILLKQRISELKTYAPKTVVFERSSNFEDNFLY